MTACGDGLRMGRLLSIVHLNELILNYFPTGL